MLFPDEVLNLRMDKRTKDFRALKNTAGWPSSSALSSSWIRWEGKILIGQKLQLKLPEKVLREYWTTTKGLPSVNHLDWGSMAKATQSVRRGKFYS